MRKTVRNAGRPENEAIGQELKKLREKAGMTQRQLAGHLNRTHAFVWKIESGSQHLDVATLLDIAMICNGDAVELIREVRDRFQKK